MRITQEKDEITFIENIVNDIKGIQYKKNLTLQQLCEANRVFRFYDTIEELYTAYFKSIKENEISIAITDGKIVITLIVEYRDNTQEVPFILEPQK